ncbi:vascular non-inflammatory molecule [Mactra antiquata]
MGFNWLLSIGLLAIIVPTDGATYRAAVYEHPVIPPKFPAISRKMALAQMSLNLKAYAARAMQAGQKNVDILVFPEDGLYGWELKTREKMFHYLEPIPDPKLVQWNPCMEPMRFPQDEIQVALSCMAKRNNLYIAAVMADVQKCLYGIDPNCHKNGLYQYNTLVVYDRKGYFIAKYHKQNRYDEPQFNAPTHPEYIWFDTEFGRFGLVICNDIMFYDPIMELIRDHNVTDIIMPLAWPDSLPLYMSVAYMSSFAVGHTVNVLAAGIKEPHKPQSTVRGSGLFTPLGPQKYVYDIYTPHGHLVVADMPINIRKTVKLPCDVNPIHFGPEHMKALVPPIAEFKSQLLGDWVTFAFLKGTEGKMTVCNNGFCCYLQYKKEYSYDRYAFGAYSGLHKAYGPFYNQICVLIKCKGIHPHTCGTYVYKAHTRFEEFHIKGNFSSPFIQPQILLSAPNYNRAIAPIGTFTYDSEGLIGSAKVKPLMHAALFARVYRKDCMTCLYG